jgi:hypothetical protein
LKWCRVRSMLMCIYLSSSKYLEAIMLEVAWSTCFAKHKEPRPMLPSRERS